MQMEVLDKSADEVVRDLGSAELNWARFCVAPDKVEAVKMPAMFPIPTHVVRRRIVKVIQSNRFDKLIWSPEHLYGQGALIGLVPGSSSVGSVGNAISSALDRQQGGTSVQYQPGNWDITLNQNFTNGINQAVGEGIVQPTVAYDVTPRLSAAVAEGGVRLLGACMKIQYLGRMDDIQGLILIGMNINGVNQSYGTIPLSDATFLSSDSIEQSPYYKCYRPSEGVRAIWFPIDESRFEFAQAHYAVDRFEWAPIRNAGAGATGISSTVETYVLPVGTASDLASGATTGYIGTTATTYPSGVPTHRLDNADHHARNRLEWQIHFQGTGGSMFKISIDQYYEVVPNETAQDDYNPQTSPHGDTDQAAKVAYQMSKQLAVVSAHESEQPSFLRQAVSKIWDYGKTFVAPLSAAFAASKGMPNLAAGIMYGAGFGSNNTSDDVRILPYKKLKFS